MSNCHGTGTYRQTQSVLQRTGAALAIVLGIAITALNLMHLNAYMLLVGPALVLAGVLEIRWCGREAGSLPFSSPADVSGRASTTAQIAFWMLLSAVALIARSIATERPLVFFIIVAIACALLVCSSYSAQHPRAVALVLCGAILLSLVVRGSVFFLTPGFPGSDAWAHDQLTRAILAEAHVPTEWSSTYYLHYPAMHLAVATTALATGIDLKLALFAGIGLPLALSSLAVFVIVRRFTGHQAALLAALLVLFTSYHLQWGTQIIPTSLGLSLFTFALMLCLRTGSPGPKELFILLLTAITLVLSHTVSSFILWTSLLVLVAVSLILQRVSHTIRLPYALRGISFMLLFMTVAMFAHWSTNPYTHAGDSFLEWMLLTARDSIRMDAGFLERPWDAASSGALADELASVSGFALFYFLVALGALQSLKRNERYFGLLAIAATVAILSAFVFAFPLFGIRTILPHRWFAFIWVLAAPLAAIGLLRLAVLTRNSVSAIAGAGIASLLAFLMVTAPVSNTDSPVYAASLTQRLTFYESELCAAAWLPTVTDGPVASDLQFASRVLRDASGLPVVHTDLTMETYLGEHHYVWRSTTLEQPVQLHGGTCIIPGIEHALDVELLQSAVYSTRSCIVFAPVTQTSEEDPASAT